MSDVAWKRWTAIREKWDPERRIGSFREGKAEMNKLDLPRRTSRL
jgi:hypothetical protein